MSREYDQYAKDPRWREIQRLIREMWEDKSHVKPRVLKAILDWEAGELLPTATLSREILRDWFDIPEEELDYAEEYVASARERGASFVVVESILRRWKDAA
jgi:hypothetical protein